MQLNSTVKSVIGIALAIITTVLATWALVYLVETHDGGKPIVLSDVLSLGQLVALTLGLGSIVLLWLQSRNEARWRRLLYYHQFFADWPADVCRAKMLSVMKELKLDNHLTGAGKPLEEAAIASIIANTEHRQGVVRYLDGFEQFSGAINAGIVAKDYAYKLDATRLLRIHTIFSPLVVEIQRTSPKAYVQFQHLANQWHAKRASEISDAIAAQSKSIAPS